MKVQVRLRPNNAHEGWVAEARSTDEPDLNFRVLGRAIYLEGKDGYGVTKEEAIENLKINLKKTLDSIDKQRKTDAEYNSKIEHREIEVL